MWTGGQRSLTAQANFRPSIEPGIWKSVNTTRMSGRLSRMTIASSAFAASATSNPASLITCAAWIRIRNSSSTIRMTGRSVVECAKMCLSPTQLSHAAHWPHEGEICSSKSAMRSRTLGSLSPSFAVRRIVSATACTWTELSGCGSVAIALLMAVVINSMMSGGKDAFEKFSIN
jgi:hypothetical protein